MCLSVQVSGADYPELIRIIVVDTSVVIEHPVVKTLVYDLSHVGQTAQSLSTNLAPQESIAKLQAQALIENNIDTIKRALEFEAETYWLIHQFDIERYPAAVVNDQAVIYDTIDLDEIIQIWRTISR